MTLLHWIAQLWRRDERPAEFIAQAAAEAVELTWPQLSAQVHRMLGAERYGYLRAHATGPVSRVAERYLALHPELAQLAEPTFTQAVLESAVELALASLARTRPAAAQRRAA